MRQGSHRSTSLLCAALIAFAGLSGCGDSVSGDGANRVNGSVHIAAGKEPGSAHTVNGSVHVDDNATVTSAGTVNGNVSLGMHATATSLATVNGSITLAEGARTTGDVDTVNGELVLDKDADVGGGLSNVNGKIRLNGAHVVRGIHTVSGNIAIMGASHVDGGILVKKTSGSLFAGDDPTIVIGPGATVQGDLRFERKVRLYVSDKATIGTVTGATAVPFSGDTPPP
jgi:DUF4097 and DUF4098 domain-containing protein YvlB